MVSRFVVVGLAVVLGIAFLARGDVGIGLVVLGLAVTRVVMIVVLLRTHRRGPRHG
jgi:hypothetical protein